LHPKKVLQNYEFSGTSSKFSIGKIDFWLKLFLGAIFTKIKCAFLKSKRKDGFFIPFAISEEKKFSSLRRVNEYFLELKCQKLEENTQFFEKRFIINGS
jgi:hypothetical protein